MNLLCFIVTAGSAVIRIAQMLSLSARAGGDDIFPISIFAQRLS